MPEVRADFAKQVVIGNGKRFLMLSVNGSIYSMDPTGKVVERFKGTAGTIWDFEVYSDAAFKDWVYCGNGVDVMQKWDGEAAKSVEWKATIGTIPKGGVLCVWENRMFISFVATNVQRVFFSEFGDPEATVAEYGFVDVRGPEDDLDAIQDLAVLGARLIVLKRRDVFFISSAVTMLNRRIGGPGVWARFQVAELEDKLYFFNPQGIFSTGGSTITMESGSINNYFPEKLNIAKAEKARLIATKDTYPRLLLALPVGQSETNNVLIELVPHINFRRIGGRRYLLLPAFFLHTIPCSVLACWNPTGTEELLVGSTFLPIDIVNEFPTITIDETLEGSKSEEPLKRGWKVFSWVANIGRIIFESGFKGAPSKSGWAPKEGLETIVGARLDSVGEITNPTCQVHVARASNFKGAFLSLWSCLQGEARTGYRFKWELEHQSPNEYKLTIEKWTAGVLTSTLATVTKIKAIYSDWGCTNLGGTQRAWGLNENTGKWEKFATVIDGTWVKGWVGVEFQEIGPTRWLLQNYRVEETPTFFNRISRLFHGTDDEGKAIEAYWHSSWMAIQGEEPKERIRRVNVELSGDVEVDVFTDFEPTPRFTQKLPFKEGTEEANQYRFARVRPETHGRFHSIRFRNVPGSEPFLINTAELSVRGGKEH